LAKGKRRQHIVPKCYLQAFADPATPQGYEPYVWVLDKETRRSTRKAPKKILTGKEPYTFKLPYGKRDLVVEDTLSRIEDRYARWRASLQYGQLPPEEERANLCIFMSAMLARTRSQKTILDTFLAQVEENFAALEDMHGAPHVESKKMAEYRRNAFPESVLRRTAMLTRVLWPKGFAFIGNSSGVPFVTSDEPCYITDPARGTHGIHGFAPASPTAEIQMTLSPTMAVLCSLGLDADVWGDATSDVARQYNLNTYVFADRLVIASKPDVFSDMIEAVARCHDESQDNAM